MEPRGPAAHDFFANMGGRGEMTKAPIELQDLRLASPVYSSLLPEAMDAD